ncbi:Eco29kI family restriction endonuclease [Frankia canadensis]|uniref:Eco29kI family restriction endonuclease n=1 Tax=Frankia canadensis TaxID=1836972 RepID=UPI00243504DF|nr:Eco29kI family restriction endonuclease [Frankia canadensis]
MESELLSRDKVPIGAVPEFLGTGIYVIYYDGDNPIYEQIADTGVPIYVGKAVPKGSRKGLSDESVVAKELWGRVIEHRESLEYAEDLSVEHFKVRYLVAEEIFIPLAERLMIRTFRPVWNQVVDGFGNHVPGSGRYDGRPSFWDILHPGRPWVLKLTGTPKFTRSEVRALVLAHFANVLLISSDAVILPPLGFGDND